MTSTRSESTEVLEDVPQEHAIISCNLGTWLVAEILICSTSVVCRCPNTHSQGSVRPSRRGGAWVSLSCQREGNREIKEFPGTAQGALSSAPRQAAGTGTCPECPWPAPRWNFQWEPGENQSRKSPTSVHLPSSLLAVVPRESEDPQGRTVERWPPHSVG